MKKDWPGESLVGVGAGFVGVPSKGVMARPVLSAESAQENRVHPEGLQVALQSHSHMHTHKYIDHIHTYMQACACKRTPFPAAMQGHIALSGDGGCEDCRV